MHHRTHQNKRSWMLFTRSMSINGSLIWRLQVYRCINRSTIIILRDQLWQRWIVCKIKIITFIRWENNPTELLLQVVRDNIRAGRIALYKWSPEYRSRAGTLARHHFRFVVLNMCVQAMLTYISMTLHTSLMDIQLSQIYIRTRY